MDILTQDKTLTSQFLMPLLFEGRKYNEILTNYKSFINAYIADFNRPQDDNKIILVFKTKQKDLPSINQVDHYIHKIKDGEETFAYVYEIPEDLLDNYTSWLIGRYSQFTDRAKQIILKFWEADENTLLYGALYKQGDVLPNFIKKNFNKDIHKEWTNEDSEWWILPRLSKEIYGTN